MHSLRILLLPFSYIYLIIIVIRNLLYDKGFLKSESFSLPVIGIGNLSTGGTGKTPLVEYLIRLLKNEYRVATLSRGYGRKSSGFILADAGSDASLIGDEPMQYHSNFRDVLVAVSEDRSMGVTNLLRREKAPQVILLDDSFQHRSISPGLNILLLEYGSLFVDDYLLPAGNLREPMSSKKRADIIVITKTPAILVPIERKNILEKVNAGEEQPVFFSFIKYGELNKLFSVHEMMQMGAGYYLEKRFTILLVTGIANPSGIIEYLRRHTDKLEIITYPDHHEFDLKDLENIRQAFNNIANQSKIIVTTEKDAMRLKNPGIREAAMSLPFFYLPIEVGFHQDGNAFNKLISDYVRENQPNNRLHTRKN